MTTKKWLIVLVVAASTALAACSEDDNGDNNGGGDTSGSSDTSGSTSGDTSGATSGDTSGSTSGDTSGTTDPCGGVTLQGTCEGNVVTYCGEDDEGNPGVVTFDCTTIDATCETINADYGVDCVLAVADSCDALDGSFCSGTNPACIADDQGDATCQENSALTCNADQAAAECQGAVAVYGCLEGHTVMARDCGAAGQTCEPISSTVGSDCVVATDAACVPYYDFCKGVGSACVEGPNDTATCKAGLSTACVSAAEDSEFVPVCDGDLLVYDCLLDHTLIGADCAALGATCAEINPQIGPDCLVAPGGSCEDASFCGGTNPVCQVGVGTDGKLTNTCVEAATNLCASTAACEGDLLILDCVAEHTASALDCAALGATCDATAGACVGVTSGMFCAPDVAQCASGLTCTDPATPDALPTCQ